MKITALTDGPLLVEGEFELVDQNGCAYERNNPTKVALCRCSGSSSKPFCDGSHRRLGFICAPQTAPEGSGDDEGFSRWESEGGH